jgi:hypothetical protein
MKSFRTKIQGREIEVATALEEGDEWGLFLLGNEAKQAMAAHLVPDLHIRLWDLSEDEEGSEAEKIHEVAVQLLQARKKSVKDAHTLLSWLVEKVREEEKKIDQLKHQVLSA